MQHDEAAMTNLQQVSRPLDAALVLAQFKRGGEQLFCRNLALRRLGR